MRMFLPAFVLAAPTEIVSAEVRPAKPEALRAGIRAEGGWASPVGWGGASIWYDLTPAFRSEVGIGLGFSGLQISILGRGLFGSPTHRFVPGLGFSLGVPIGNTYLSDHGSFGESSPVIVPWLNVDALGYEYQSDDGWTALIAIGGTTPLQERSFSRESGPLRPLVAWFPQGHIAFGKAF
jgi:hypothetical protein